MVIKDKQDLIKIANENIKIGLEKQYTINNTAYQFPELARENYSSMFDDDYFKSFPEMLNVIHQSRLKTGLDFSQWGSIQCRNETTVDGIFRLRPAKAIVNSGFAVLNFASAKKPSGGFLNGALAQEESLAYCSNLYTQQQGKVGKKYYKLNRENPNNGLYQNVFFNSNVFFFRDSNYDLTPKPFMCTVYTCPAVNLKETTRNYIPYSQAYETMKNRMRDVLQAMVWNNAHTIILGAFGCGIFGWDSEVVAEIWRDLLIDEDFRKFFRTICFSVYDKSKDKTNYNNFKSVFKPFEKSKV